jgi:hypothetical protein
LFFSFRLLAPYDGKGNVKINVGEKRLFR